MAGTTVAVLLHDGWTTVVVILHPFVEHPLAMLLLVRDQLVEMEDVGNIRIMQPPTIVLLARDRFVEMEGVGNTWIMVAAAAAVVILLCCTFNYDSQWFFLPNGCWGKWKILVALIDQGWSVGAFVDRK
ncbi:hypothetical protein GOBAR_DD10432 [Gossypium barbadense]|nr:hypothetical protein GOBAR_DD10432 [Gossypium barbadense]